MEVMSLTAPSSPRQLSGCFLSAPTSPRRFNEFYREFEEAATRNFSDRLTVPFDWEETPGTPRKITNDDDDDIDFAFEIGGKLETTSLFAEELFDGGKIKPLKPPPYLQLDHHHQPQILSPRSPRSPIAHGKNIIRKAFSPRKKPDNVDPFEVAMDKARNGLGEERGRGRRQNSGRRVARSLSPFRVSAYPWEEQEQEQEQEQRDVQEQRKGTLSSIPSTSSSACVSCKSSSSKKWRLKDFLLFRSASEGRARHNKDSVKTFTSLFRKQEDTKNSSSRGRGSSSVSAHEFHYMSKKAETKDLKKKTFLPYMQIGRFAF
ncbi:putative transcription factor C2C2-GATA family [Arabidopsis thaliana]|jgi:hypothetical protein|uniref:AR781 n=3 Tax=Arabidopsis TaxID=3701 RepID=A0A178VPT1_ARATH|nr:AR781, pheromone receptor-like protein (DUF1645) [Arabidopsis thaliana]KAG7637541.1 hypothetical protein ISN45_At02g020580 [Arabidopsis thaliana x Arabidopsis arenosa]AAC14501.1 AR781, similar to yeast pheromone receptor [Arabidopsis thaliana]AAN12941.1 AR781 [Arabidopsis thaliana]AEC07852.1 AR781, pheromone receptor-like protein (DUF1645) [Arabidopsis thaliana]OAP07245.1 AR781 [Arabidopsis thaliana]|eukprot:NP_180221.1 AR781, pheromone receptor-like protein (DUF1645) [Arabidopsis thaliana]